MILKLEYYYLNGGGFINDLIAETSLQVGQLIITEP